MQSMSPLFWIIPLAIALYAVEAWICGRKVRKYFQDKRPGDGDPTIKWDFFGPFEMGHISFKYKVELAGEGGARRVVYAVTSLFGDVYIKTPE